VEKSNDHPHFPMIINDNQSPKIEENDDNSSVSMLIVESKITEN
jgi:hypothetical protein